MDSGFYSSFTGFAARMDALDIIANNLANANTTGFKSHRSFYSSFSSWLQPSLTTPINSAVNQYGVLGGARLDLSAGSFEPTGNDTDVAIEGKGFFNIQTQNGIRYTRAGNFSLNAQRQLVTSHGDLVLNDQKPIPGPILIPAGQLTISPDGTVSVDGAIVATLKISDFAPGTNLTAEGSTYFTAPEDSAKPAAEINVRHGSLEASNSDPVPATVALIEIQRNAQLMEKALSIFNNDFNRTAVQQIAVL